jgi:CRP/FNR family transcriptional regulator, cyclic AMP receptor protein
MFKVLADDRAFRGVSAPMLQALVGRAAVADARKGEVIYEAGQDWGRLGFIVEGCIAMLAVGGGPREHLYDHIYPGQFFGISSMFDGKPEMAQTVAVSEKARYTAIDRDAVIDLCRTDGALAVAFAVTLARRVRRVTALLAAQMNLTAQERVARYLLEFAREGQGLCAAMEPLPLMTQAQIGAAAGTVKDVAARTIGILERHGAIKRQRGRVRFLDRTILSEFARLHE